MTRAFWIAALLIAIATIGGTILDPAPARPPTMRAGYRVLEVDLHAHTRFSDGLLSPFDLVLQARRRGLDALGVTEHNNVWPGQMARWFSRAIDGPTILVGEEVTTKRFHVHGVGLERSIRPAQPLPDILDQIHAQGGFAIAAHPVRRTWPYFLPVLDRLDASEVMHPLAFSRSSSGWRWEDLRDFYLEAESRGHKLTAIGSSDYHFFSPLGVCRTLVFATSDDEASVMDALKRGRTVVYALDGSAYGDRELIGALEKAPYTMRDEDYGYRGAGTGDRLLRTFGWIGLVALMLFRRRS